MVGVVQFVHRQNFFLMLASYKSVITSSDQLLLLFPYMSTRRVTSDRLCTTSLCDCEGNFKYACFN